MRHDNDNYTCKLNTGRIHGAGIIFNETLFLMNPFRVKTHRGWSMCSRQSLQSFIGLIYITYLII